MKKQQRENERLKQQLSETSRESDYQLGKELTHNRS